MSSTTERLMKAAQAKGQRGPQQAVRAGRLEYVLERFKAELEIDFGNKMAIAQVAYHQNFVKPLEERIAWLELPWYRKLQARVQDWTLKAELWARKWRAPKSVEVVTSGLAQVVEPEPKS